MDRKKSGAKFSKSGASGNKSAGSSRSSARPKRKGQDYKGASSAPDKGEEKYPDKKKAFGKFYKQKGTKSRFEPESAEEEQPVRKQPAAKKSSPKKKEDEGLIRLNKYLAHSGICSRREADTFIQAGVVRVNGVVVNELGHKVLPTDKVQFEDQTLQREKMVYVLLNKPKGFITSMDDPQERKTVMSLVEHAVSERIYPVGRLDRNTTGLLLFTNDGLMTKKLTHPSHQIKKIYHVSLDKKLDKKHFEEIQEGIELEDGPIKPDELAYVNEESDRREIGIEIHSGRNRIVRRIFEKFGYKVMKLDRVKFGGLTKKDLPRSKWRILSPTEINMLKMLS
jgi:23S rRNA pseudouridine2605 synthase